MRIPFKIILTEQPNDTNVLAPNILSAPSMAEEFMAEYNIVVPNVKNKITNLFRRWISKNTKLDGTLDIDGLNRSMTKSKALERIFKDLNISHSDIVKLVNSGAINDSGEIPLTEDSTYNGPSSLDPTINKVKLAASNFNEGLKANAKEDGILPATSIENIWTNFKTRATGESDPTALNAYREAGSKADPTSFHIPKEIVYAGLGLLALRWLLKKFFS